MVVTGASAGVGRAVVRRFARDGARIALIARGHDGLEGARRDVDAAGGRALPLAVDVADWAAHHRRRELWVGLPTAAVIVGNRLAPGAADRYLAATGYDAQQTGEPEDPDRPDNLWDPVDERQDRGAHGAFGDRAVTRSEQLWAATYRGATLGILATAALVSTALLRLRQRTT